MMARTQILVHTWRGDPEQEFQPCFTEGLNQKFSSVCGTGYFMGLSNGYEVIFQYTL